MARFAVVVAVVALLTCACVRGSLINVGGKRRAWRPGVNYIDWASHRKVHVGDWIWFRYNRYLYDVLEVNQTSYEHCISEGFIANCTRGKGRDMFMVTQARPYYFICSKASYCKHGMKVAINVTRAPVPPQAPGLGPILAPTPAPAPAPAPKPGSGLIPAPAPEPRSGLIPAPAPSAKSGGTSMSQGVGTLMLGVMLSFVLMSVL